MQACCSSQHRAHLVVLAVLLAGLTLASLADAGPKGGSKVDKPTPSRPKPLTQWEKKLLGEHKFGVQFIWDGYGSATIKQTPDGLEIRGEQYAKIKAGEKPRAERAGSGNPGSRPDRDYVKIAGLVEVVNQRTLKVTGVLETYLRTCCKQQNLEGTFVFKRHGKRKYYRLQNPHRSELCDKYTCHYYIDLFL